VRIARSADDVWAAIGDPARVHEWFVGIDSTTVDGDVRVITTGAGLPIPEQIVTHDPIQRRFQYRITGGMVREHLSTLDVLDLGDGTCLAVYSADADPSTMALVIAGAAGSALEHLRDQMEAQEVRTEDPTRGDAPPGRPSERQRAGRRWGASASERGRSPQSAQVSDSMTLSALRLIRSNSSFVRLPSLRCLRERRLALMAWPLSGIG
jgi:hypothetical protein